MTEEQHVMQEREVQLFGQTITLITPDDEFIVGDSAWRGRAVYEPFLTTHTLPKAGVAVDIGSGYGEFAIPFAKAYPAWTVWCFEPYDVAFDALKNNIRRHNLSNVIAVNAAVGPGVDTLDEALRKAIEEGAPEIIKTTCQKQKFGQHKEKPGYIEYEAASHVNDFDEMFYPTLPANALTMIAPTLLKLIAPGCEEFVLSACKDLPIHFVIGEMWKMIPSGTVYSDAKDAARETYLPVAGSPLVLRKTQSILKHEPRLDVVVAMYNTKEYIRECIDSIIDNDVHDIRAIVVDDGSTDGCGDLVAELYANNPRVVLHRKLNGGCASARNYGRLMSKASHIAFMDADDVADPQLFPQLLELARYTGCEIVQGGFDLLYQNEDGSKRIVPSYEDELFKNHERLPFFDKSYFQLDSKEQMVGQPTIWRRVYRREFLDNKKLWFPEHIRAFDDQIFQLLTLIYARDLACVDHVKLHYRQHPGQDIKQGDERFFYSLEMFRIMFKRGVAEGWNDFQTFFQSYVNTVNWIHDELRHDLRPKFIEGAAELWVYMQKTLGTRSVFEPFGDDVFNAVDFSYSANKLRNKLEGFHDSFAWSYLDAHYMHRDMI